MPVASDRARPGVDHFPHYIVENLFGAGAQELVAGDLPGVKADAGELRIVITQFLKMGRRAKTRGLMTEYKKLALDNERRMW